MRVPCAPATLSLTLADSPLHTSITRKDMRPKHLELFTQLRLREESLIKQPREPFRIRCFHQLIHPLHHVVNRSGKKVACSAHAFNGPFVRWQGLVRIRPIIFGKTKGLPESKMTPEALISH